MKFKQETNSDLVCFSKSSKIEPEDSTAGSKDAIAPPFLLLGATNPTQEICAIISEIENPIVLKQTKEILLSIQTALEIIYKCKSNIGRTPLLHTHFHEDGAVLIEWVFPDFRIGFNIEPDPEETGWHIVSSKNLDGETFSKHLTDFKEPIEAIAALILYNT